MVATVLSWCLYNDIFFSVLFLMWNLVSARWLLEENFILEKLRRSCKRRNLINLVNSELNIHFDDLMKSDGMVMIYLLLLHVDE